MKIIDNKYFKYIRTDRENKPYILITAGVHGNEVSGIHYLSKNFEKIIHRYTDFNFIIIPCVNKTGYLNKTRFTLEGENEVDINRNVSLESPFKEGRNLAQFIKDLNIEFIFNIDLHETVKKSGSSARTADSILPDGFYYYEYSLDPKTRINDNLISIVEKMGHPICKHKDIWGDINNQGYVPYPENAKNKEYLSAPTFDNYLIENKISKNAVTLEITDNINIRDRISINKACVTYILDVLRRRVKS